MTSQSRLASRLPDRQKGVSLIEVLIAIVVLSVGLMGAAQTMGTAAGSVLIAQEQLIAKQKAREAIESVYTARNTQDLNWNDIRNAAAGGVFLDGFQDLRETGADGIANTLDDADEEIETLVLPGPDGDLGTSDDKTRALDSFKRNIAISTVLMANNDVDPDIRKIEVQIQYTFRGLTKTVTLSSLISRFS